VSKQSEAKEKQGYRKSAACCMNCDSFQRDVVPLSRHPGDTYSIEKNKRCGIGGFAVQSTGHCAFFQWKA
jgi:hypothetical protein